MADEAKETSKTTTVEETQTDSTPFDESKKAEGKVTEVQVQAFVVTEKTDKAATDKDATTAEKASTDAVTKFDTDTMSATDDDTKAEGKSTQGSTTTTSTTQDAKADTKSGSETSPSAAPSGNAKAESASGKDTTTTKTTGSKSTDNSGVGASSSTEAIDTSKTASTSESKTSGKQSGEEPPSDTTTDEQSHNDESVNTPSLQEIDEEDDKSNEGDKSVDAAKKDSKDASATDKSSSGKQQDKSEVSKDKSSSSSSSDSKADKKTSSSDSSDDGKSKSSKDKSGKDKEGNPGPAWTRLLGYGLLFLLAEKTLVFGLQKAGIFPSQFSLTSSIKDAASPHIETLSTKLNGTMGLNLDKNSPLYLLTQQKERPGYKLAKKGAKVEYPVMMVPGFITSGLTVWSAQECAIKHFRQRIWTAFNGGFSFVLDRECWRQHMMLDPYTGKDPENVKLRAAEGFEAADYFMANYWVFGKIIQNLADIGYTPSEMTMEPYDWRLSFQMLEERDGYLTKLKVKIEGMKKVTGKKVVLTTHSMGAQVCHYFFNWVTTSEKKGGGGGGENWIDDHIHAYVNIAGSHLGVPKASTALLSGEMSDTVFMGTFGTIMENFFGRVVRRDMWVTWGSLWAMQPLGGDNVWCKGHDMCVNRTDDDPMCPLNGTSPLISMSDTNKNISQRIDAAISSAAEPENDFNRSLREFAEKQHHTVEDTVSFLGRFGGTLGSNLKNVKLHALYENDTEARKSWHDVSRTPLPKMKHVPIYCLYGTGIDTERAYYYTRNLDEQRQGVTGSIQDPPVVLDKDKNDDKRKVKTGVRYTDGDGSVPLLSLGYICADAWTRKESGLNPSRTKVYTREYPHRPKFTIDDPMRGGPLSAEHVDILGNDEVMLDLLRVITNTELEEVNQNKIFSNIKEIGEKIWKDGGLSRKSFY
jgi:phospholipid:diacylglycerol acyltransferase